MLIKIFSTHAVRPIPHGFAPTSLSGAVGWSESRADNSGLDLFGSFSIKGKGTNKPPDKALFVKIF